MKKKQYRFGMAIIVMCILWGLSGCQAAQMREYYEEKSNYIEAKGTVSHISYDEESESIYIDFSSTAPVFDDTCFKIVGDNCNIAKENGIEGILKIGSEVSFITAPQYFGDGYVMPIVGLTVDGEEILSFDEGYNNLLKWYRGES